MRFWLASAALAVAGSVFAADPPCPNCPNAASPTPTTAVVKVFAVADLVTPIPDFAMPARPMPAPPMPAPVPVVMERVGIDFNHPTPRVMRTQEVILPTPRAVAPPTPIQVHVGIARTDAVPPGGVRVVRNEEPASPTAVLIGGLNRTEPAPVPCAPSVARCSGVSGDALVRVVTSTVRPASWKGNGGTGTVEFYPLGHSLVVQNSPAIVAEVETLLDTLRRAQERTVAVECRLITVPQVLADRLGLELAPTPESGPSRVMTEAQIAQLLEAAQGDRRTRVVMAPKVTLLDGQTSRIECGEQRTFTTGIDVRAMKGQSVAVPKQETVKLGTTLQVCPTISADGKFVQLALSVRQADVSEPVQLMPVTTMVTPVFEGGSQGQPVPFTQFIQQPCVAISEASCNLMLADGATTMIPVGKRMVETRSEFGPPVLSQVPYVNRLFKNVDIAREPQHVIAVVTARVVTTPSEEKACCHSPAAGLVAEYRKACAAGHTEEAMKLALKALAADPACFAK